MKTSQGPARPLRVIEFFLCLFPMTCLAAIPGIVAGTAQVMSRPGRLPFGRLRLPAIMTLHTGFAGVAICALYAEEVHMFVMVECYSWV